MKKFENLGRSLSKEEQKAVAGGYGDGGGSGCLGLDADCNSDVQCCSNWCSACPPGSCPTTGKVCHPA